MFFDYFKSLYLVDNYILEFFVYCVDKKGVINIPVDNFVYKIFPQQNPSYTQSTLLTVITITSFYYL